jgi:GTPase-activating protein SST2
MALTNPSHPNHQHLPTRFSASDSSPHQSPSSLSDDSLSSSEVPIAEPSTSTSDTADFLDRQASYKNRQSISSTKANRTGLFTLAALARDRTSSAIASFTEPTIRSRPSSSNLAKQSTTTVNAPPLPSAQAAVSASTEYIQNTNKAENSEALRGSQTNLSVDHSRRSHSSTPTGQRQSLLDTDPPSQPYDDTDTTQPKPILQNHSNKMHQTSSRLLRMTDDERPFTRVRRIDHAIPQSGQAVY